MTQPTISPDGERIAFAADGAIWSVPSAGGTAHILVSDSATDSRPLFSPDGVHLAFVSEKTGNGDIYLLDLDSGSLERLTFADSGERPSGFSSDGKWLYFTTSRGNIGGLAGVYRVRVSGGTPMPVSLELYRNEEAGAPSPDGSRIALVGLGWGSAQWWRHGSAHIDHGAIWLLQNDGSHDYKRITPADARAEWPMWAADGKSVYYLSDRGGTENIWQASTDGKEHAVTQFDDGRCVWPTIGNKGKTIVFQRNWKIWTLDTASGKAQPLSIALGGAVTGPGIEHRTFRDDFSELRLSPDGKKLAFIVHGEVFAIAANKKGPAQRITHTPSAEFGLTWAPDSKSIVYVSSRDGVNHLFRYNFADEKEKRLTHGSENDSQPRFAPNGKHIAFVRGADKLEILNPTSGRVRDLADGELTLHHPLSGGHSFVWSPDGKWIAYFAWGKRMYRNAYVVPFSGGKPRPVSFLGNTFSGSLRWSPNGKALFFSTGQRTEAGQIARVNLTLQTPEFREQKFLDLFTEETPPGMPGKESEKTSHNQNKGHGRKNGKKAKTKIDFDGIARRLQLLPTGLNVGTVVVSPDGKTLLFSASVAGHQNLYTWSLDPLALHSPVAHQITSTSGRKSSIQFSPDGHKVWYLEGGKIYSVSVKGHGAKHLVVSASMNVNFAKEKEVVFNEAWQGLEDNFHDPNMNGVDWKAVRKRYAPVVAGAANPATLHAILNQMVGELNSSHSGVRDRHSSSITGRLGLRFDPATYENRGKFKIDKIIPLGPAAVTGKLSVGDYVVAIDGTPLQAGTNIFSLLDHRIGKETVLSITPGPSALHHHDVKVKPVSSGTITNLTYRMWTEHNRKEVEKLSDGKFGYVHMPDMSMRSLQHLYREINALNGTKEGVVVDIRNNFGGFVNAYALDALTRKHYLNMTFRGMQRVSARPVLGQRALERPTVLITNRVVLSDGEDFTEGYEELGLGKVVGEPTAGWIIYTSNVPMIDGSVVRLPFITVTTKEGKPMEMHPRPVDVHIAEPLGESYHDKDSRLAAAVKVLLKQLRNTKSQP